MAALDAAWAELSPLDPTIRRLDGDGGARARAGAAAGPGRGGGPRTRCDGHRRPQSAPGLSAPVSPPRRPDRDRCRGDRRCRARRRRVDCRDRAPANSPRRSSSTPPAPGPTSSPGSPGLPPVGLQPKRRTALIVAGAGRVRHAALADGRSTPTRPAISSPTPASCWSRRPTRRRSTPCDVQPEELDVAIAIDRLMRATTIEVDARRAQMGRAAQLCRPTIRRSTGSTRWPTGSSGSPGRAATAS